MQTTITSIGLGLDIIGVLILIIDTFFNFNKINKVLDLLLSVSGRLLKNREGNTWEGLTDREKTEIQRRSKYSNIFTLIALGLILFGFILQLLCSIPCIFQ